MKTIDIKSLLIGGLLASTILLGMAAAVPKDTGTPNAASHIGHTWDNKQAWQVVGGDNNGVHPQGYQPFAVKNNTIFWRKRIR